MDWYSWSHWSGSSLGRPRMIVALCTTAAVAIGFSLYRQASLADSYVEEVSGPGLHRSNALRRHRRRSSADQVIHDPNLGPPFDTESEGAPDENQAVNPPRVDDEPMPDAPPEDNWWHDPPPPRAGQNIVSLLFSVSEDNARRNALVHRGCACNGCGATPIRGIRYRCANCADFDLCETCESQGQHIKTHIFYKVRVPAPSFAPRQMQPVWYPGDADQSMRSLPRDLMQRLSQRTGFERPELEAFWEQWTFIANTEWRDDPNELCIAMDRRTFERCLVPSSGHRHTAPNLIHERMFAFYDTNNDDTIGFEEFLVGLSYRKSKDKLRKMFSGYDIDGDGFISRRDCLRIFRAYYVLFKQMHKDILETLDDQVLCSSEAQQLVASRQPLSSLFGRDTAIPRSERAEDRPLIGKITHSNGEVVLALDDTTPISEDRRDEKSRHEILDSLFRRPVFSFESNGEFADQAYIQALLNPPTRAEDLPAVLTGTIINTNTDPLDGITLDPLRPPARQMSSASGEEQNDGQQPEGNGGGDDGPGPALINARQIHAPIDLQTARRPALSRNWTQEIPSETAIREQLEALSSTRSDRKLRVRARRKLLDRWKRRQFYLDEEEGATPPPGWTEANDVLGSGAGEPGSSKSAQAESNTTARSRSSSKVRFVEDTDDFDVRSTPSTSSRSVPERWGGMEIPDAEKDAGKEIMYQVTQQAFNELLDVLFKENEDMAVKAAETKADRDKYRHLFEPIVLNSGSATTSTPSEPRPLSVQEAKNIAEHFPHASVRIADDAEGQVDGASAEMSGTQDGDMESPSDTADATETSPSPPAEPFAEIAIQYDPTMPQFRPNSLADTAAEPTTPTPTIPPPPRLQDQHDPQLLANGERILRKITIRASSGSGSGSSSTSRSSKRKTNTAPDDGPPSQQQLEEYKRIDIAETAALARGGWGKLDYAEFEAIYKREEERDYNRLDYLGSWIDFCIP